MYVTIAGKLGMGDLRDPDTIIGPIIGERQRERIKRHIEVLVTKVQRCNRWSLGGIAVHPRLLDVTADMDVFVKNLVGCLIPIQRF